MTPPTTTLELPPPPPHNKDHSLGIYDSLANKLLIDQAQNKLVSVLCLHSAIDSKAVGTIESQEMHFFTIHHQIRHRILMKMDMVHAKPYRLLHQTSTKQELQKVLTVCLFPTCGMDFLT